MFIGFDSFSMMFNLVFFLIIGVLIFNIISSIARWNKNNHSPRLTVEAKIVTKRMDVSTYHHHNAGDASGAHGHYTTHSTAYYVTFEVESGDRIELKVEDYDYGMLVEGDQGKLTFQGTRYLGFERKY